MVLVPPFNWAGWTAMRIGAFRWSAYRHDWNRRLPHHAFRHAAEKEMTDAGASMGRHHDQVRAVFLGGGTDGDCGVAGYHHDFVRVSQGFARYPIEALARVILRSCQRLDHKRLPDGFDGHWHDVEQDYGSEVRFRDLPRHLDGHPGVRTEIHRTQHLSENMGHRSLLRCECQFMPSRGCSRTLSACTMGTNRQHWARSLPHHSLRHAAEEQMRKSAPSMRAHHDDLRTGGLLRMENRDRRFRDVGAKFIGHPGQMSIGEFLQLGR